MIFNGRCKQCGTHTSVYTSGLCLNCTKENNSYQVKEKPPLGLTPKFIKDKERMYEIINAMMRYYDADKRIPQEWIVEFSELNSRVKE